MKTLIDIANAFRAADRKISLFLSGIIAVAITILFVIMSLVKGRILAEDIRTNRENGSAAAVVLENVSAEQYRKLLALNDINGVGVVNDIGCCYRNGRKFCVCSVTRETDFWEIMSPAYEGVTGDYPQAADEVMLSLHMLSDLGIKDPEIGMDISLEILRGNWLTSGAEDIQMVFRLSGYYSDYVPRWEKLPVAYFSEALMQEQEIDLFPCRTLIQSDLPWMSGEQMEKHLCQSLNLRNDQSIQVINEGSLKTLRNMAGGIGIAAAGALWIVFSMSLLIYTVFSFDISRIKKQYGLLKVIGATPKQMKGVFFLQSARIILTGSIAGSLLGSMIVWLAVPELIERIVFAGTGSAESLNVFSWKLLGLSVCLGGIGAIAALRHLMRRMIRLSPVEWLAYEGKSNTRIPQYKASGGSVILEIAWRNFCRNRKRTLLSICALFLSVELSLLWAVISEGMDQTHRIEQNPDFEIGVTKEAVAEYIYANNGRRIDETTGHELLPQELLESIAETAGLAEEDMLKCIGSYGIFHLQSVSMVPRKLSYRKDVDIITELTVQIVPEEWVNELKKYVDRGKLNIDMGTFQEGRGFLLLHSHELSPQQQREADKVIGEKLSGSFCENGGKRFELICCGYLDFTGKNFPVLNMPWEGKNLNYIIISAHTAGQFKITPYVYSVSFDVSQQKEPEIKRKLQDILAEFNQETEYYTPYYLIAKSDILAENHSYILAVRSVMGVFNVVLMLFAVLGYAITVMTGMLDRQTEFAVMRSIGMTREQLREMLMCEGIFYGCCTVGLLLSMGNIILTGAGMAIRRNISYFAYHFPVFEFLCCVILILGISVGIPYVVCGGKKCKLQHKPDRIV